MRFQDGYPLVVFLLLTVMIILAKIAGAPAEAATIAPRNPVNTFSDTTAELNKSMDLLEGSARKWNSSVRELDTEVERVAAHLL